MRVAPCILKFQPWSLAAQAELMLTPITCTDRFQQTGRYQIKVMESKIQAFENHLIVRVTDSWADRLEQHVV